MERTSGGRGLAAESASVEHEEPIDLVSCSRDVTDVSFGAIVDTDDEPRILWTAPNGLEIAGRGVAARFTAAGPNRFERIRTSADRVFDALEHDGPPVARPRAFGGFSFHDGHAPNPPWTGFDAASFVVPRAFVTRDDTGGIWVTAVGNGPDDAYDRLDHWHERLTSGPAMRASGSGPGVTSTRRSTSPEEWNEQIESALGRIEDGRLTKVVLAQALSIDLESSVDVPTMLERLRRQYPNCYRFLVSHETGGTFFGAPPEQLVSKRDDRVETEALAGSVARGETPESDDELATRMLADEKLEREHELVVEAIRDQLEALACELAIGDRRVRKLNTIQHLRTPLSATLAGDHHVLELVEALHPTPAVGGVPPTNAWETIRQTEAFDRGWYAAPIGWFDADGNGEFAVALRSALAVDDTVTLFAGNGIVADSDPAEEWTEVQLKFRPILDELKTR
ncbi:isochorismate synthase [Natrarchaeobius halalkaliphilus]|uniref:isochorismate synthase n=1 Tax=Natrarchaeobius halalkaliphilus TaxID=1679091 RepID=A0A3N6LLG5_9EURY|nr:isochorismate synthase [Natrarchaeobius halalkaliphilus]RQG89823.1 isochorismate synthase [Natrarchaeobius halalkaliphilus]